MTKNSTAIDFGAVSDHALAALILSRMAYWNRQLHSGAALRSRRNETHDARCLEDFSPAADDYSNSHCDNSGVCELRKRGAGRALLGLAMAVGPSLGGH